MYDFPPELNHLFTWETIAHRSGPFNGTAVLHYLAQNKNIPKEILQKLSEDKSKYVKRKVANKVK